MVFDEPWLTNHEQLWQFPFLNYPIGKQVHYTSLMHQHTLKLKTNAVFLTPTKKFFHKPTVFSSIYSTNWGMCYTTWVGYRKSVCKALSSCGNFFHSTSKLKQNVRLQAGSIESITSLFLNEASSWISSTHISKCIVDKIYLHLGLKVLAPLHPYLKEKNFVLFLFLSG